ncbi:EAL domain-containing protein [Altererythrobacter lauratis]|uniref:EAL domain-containing protein n=1 Tax=Alteraurantiacibacter lauratis TaxID=2054627 RepID=A0ABV7EAB2_9SPHN
MLQQQQMPFSHLVATPAGDRRRQLDRRARVPQAVANELQGAMAEDRIAMLFQPQYCCASGAVAGAEALVRWPHPQRGLIAGDELFRIAMRADLARALSDHVIRRALMLASEWEAGLHLSLNITAADLAAPDFPDAVAAALCASGFAPERLTLEITEQALVHDLDSSAAQLTKLVDLGIRIALDDFGAGFCNFRYLKKLPLHFLKLDRSMVEGIADDRRDLEVLRGIVALAGALDLAVIAEGIESEAQRDAVMREGCFAWQGFLGGKPMPPEEFAQL